MRKQFQAIALAAFVLTAVAGGAVQSQAADIDWKGYTYSPATQTVYKGLEEMLKKLEAETDGKIAVKFNGGGSLPIKAKNITQAVGDGVVDFASDAFYTGNVPIGGIAFLPGLFLNEQDLAKATPILMPYIQKALAKRGVELLGSYHYPLQVMWSRNDLTSLDGLKGQKVRVSSGEQGEFVKRFGGIPVTMGSSEIAPAMQRGILDAVITAASGGARRIKDLVKSTYQMGPNLHFSLIIANKESFDALPADVQAKIRSLAAETGAWINKTLKREEVEFTAKYAAEGIAVHQASQSDQQALVNTMKPYWSEWAKEKGGDAEAALAEIRNVLGR